MSKKKILITGANGFIGSSLTKFLSNTNNEIYGLDINPLLNELNPFINQFYQIDISSPFSLDIEFDYIIHLAALNITNIGNAQYPDFYNMNVIGTKNLLHGVKSNALVFLSTAKVYEQLEGIIDEASPLLPIGNYEKSKLEAETVCKNEFKGKNNIILRPVNIAGPGQAKKALIPVLFNKALSNSQIEIFAPRNQKLQFLSIYDFNKAIYKIVNTHSLSGIFNIASPDAETIENVTKYIIALCNSKSKIAFTNMDKEKKIVINSEKIQHIISWKAKDTIQEILIDFKNNIHSIF